MRRCTHVRYVWLRHSLWRNISSFLEIGVGGLQGLGTDLMCRSLLFSGKFFQYVFQSWETYFLRVSRLPAGIDSSGQAAILQILWQPESTTLLPDMLRCDRVHISLRLNCWLDTISLITLTIGWRGRLIEESACMTDSESVHLMPHYREFCVMCCIASRIACSSAENIKKKYCRTHCWIMCKLLVIALLTSSAFLDPSV